MNQFLERRENSRDAQNSFDPEIPVNIYDLGPIYRIEPQEDNSVDIDMTLTAPIVLQ